ncbi:MAG TPA: hypothetical protein VG994_06415, partial [Steroidobacteraceae bacterium]|nr:hypothetical protein [Steroidobacteraceae bacterium]
MSHDPLLELLPDLVLLMRRDGSILAQGGGRDVGPLRPAEWSQATAELLRLLVRRSIAERSSVEARFADAGCEYAVRVSAQGPDRALAVIRAGSSGSPEATDTSGEHPR